MRISIGNTICVLIACAMSSFPTLAAASDTRYYFGNVEMRSPDGSVLYGKSVSVVKRVVDPVLNKIIETVLQPPRSAGQKAKEITTTLTRVGSSDVFSAADDEQTFTGELAFSGNEWDWSQWTYKIKLIDGSRLEGTGSIDLQGIRTEKTFYKPDGVAFVLLKENLKPVSQKDFDIRHAEIVGP